MTTFQPERSRVAPAVLHSSSIPKMAAALTQRGYLVLPPAEMNAARTIQPHQTMHHRILSVLHRRYVLGSKQDPRNPALWGLTDVEISDLLHHPDLHRRMAELRSCGLATQEIEAVRVARAGRKVRHRVSVITPAGIAALEGLDKASGATRVSA